MKITDDIVANLLCYLLDNYEMQPLSEEKLQEIGNDFLQSEYNKSNALEDGIKERIEKWKKFHQFSYKEGRDIIDILSAVADAFESENKILKARLEEVQEILEEA